jgi:hypothetical protein
MLLDPLRVVMSRELRHCDAHDAALAAAHGSSPLYVSCYTIVLPFFSCCEVAVSLIHLLLPATIL